MLDRPQITAIKTFNIYNLLSELMNKSRTDMSQSYNVNPLYSQFRCSALPWCERKHVFNNLVEIFTFLIDDFTVTVVEKAKELPTESHYLQDKADSGTIIHAIAQMLLKSNSNYTIIHEDPVYWEDSSIHLFGHVDTQIIDHNSDLLLVIDIKTVDTFHFIDQSGAKLENIEQLNLYLRYLSRKFPDKTIKGFLWYLLRVTHNEYTGESWSLINLLTNKHLWRCFEFQFSEELYQYSIQKAKNIFEQIRAFKLPAKSNIAWECENTKSKCPFHVLCYQYNIQTIDQLAKELLV